MAHHPTDWWGCLHHCQLYGLLMGWGSSSVPVAVTCYRSYWHFFKERRYLSCGLGRLCSRWLLRPRSGSSCSRACLVSSQCSSCGTVVVSSSSCETGATFSRSLGSCLLTLPTVALRTAFALFDCRRLVIVPMLRRQP
jgi:hypothetical protein